MFKVRFNLGKGARYMKWKITSPSGEHTYHEPSEVRLIMLDCFLRNQQQTAQNIFEGAHKSICAWVECEHVEVKILAEKREYPGKSSQAKYNPRVMPHWVVDGTITDNETVGDLMSVNRGLFLI